MSVLLVVLNASALCVARTDICAPPTSTMTGQVGDQGGSVTITPPVAMKALGAEFRAGTPLVVDVTPWWSGQTRGSIVHVRGELARESVVSGAKVAGSVRIGQLQGRPGAPQLVEATDLKGGRLQAFGAGTIDVVPGMRIGGAVDIGGGMLEITSAQPIRGLGLELASGSVRITQRSDEATISGTLARPQELGGVLVDRYVVATIAAGRTRFQAATLGRATRLELLGLPTGEAPAGTTVSITPTGAALGGPGPFTVCGLSVIAAPMTPPTPVPQVRLDTQQQGRVSIYAKLVAPDVEVQPGLHLTGVVTASYDKGTCTLRMIEGTLARESAPFGLKLAKNKAITIGEIDQDRFVRGTLAAPTIVDGLTLIGAAGIRVTGAGDLHLFDGTLAKAAPFEQWQVPAGTHVTRSGDDRWSFEVPRNTVANAIAPHRGERVELVTQAQSDGSMTTFTLTRPHRPAGTKLALTMIGIAHDSGCVIGNVATTQRAGMFEIPAKGGVTVCGGAIVGAETGSYAVPTVKVGRWFATVAIAGAAGSPPPPNAPLLARTSKPAGPIAGYWLQINSLCQAPSGIEVPPPPERWIWVDTKGEATVEADRLVLTRDAAKAGKACPVYPCCVP